MADKDPALEKEKTKIIKGYIQVGIILVAIVIVFSLLFGGKKVLEIMILSVALAILVVLLGGVIGYRKRMNLLQHKTTVPEQNRKMGYVYIVLGVALILIYAILVFIEKRQTSLELDVMQLGFGFALLYLGIRQLRKRTDKNPP
jgi:archaellum biogenesis protein FlaJ (TadC family)